MELLKTLLTAGLGAAIGAGATIWVGYLGFLNKDRELDVKMVEVSLSILAGENESTKVEPAKRFALRALEKFSELDIPDADFEAWVAGEPLKLSPLLGWPMIGKWTDIAPAPNGGAKVIPLATEAESP